MSQFEIKLITTIEIGGLSNTNYFHTFGPIFYYRDIRGADGPIWKTKGSRGGHPTPPWVAWPSQCPPILFHFNTYRETHFWAVCTLIKCRLDTVVTMISPMDWRAHRHLLERVTEFKPSQATPNRHQEISRAIEQLGPCVSHVTSHLPTTTPSIPKTYKYG